MNFNLLDIAVLVLCIMATAGVVYIIMKRTTQRKIEKLVDARGESVGNYWRGELERQTSALRQQLSEAYQPFYEALGIKHTEISGDPVWWIHHLQDRIEQQKKQNDRLSRYAFRLPLGEDVRIVTTAIGTFAIKIIGGYFGESAIFVYFPIGFGFSQEIAVAFNKATEGKFFMDPARGSSNGGDDLADAMITAGLDYAAFCRGEQGYFKESAPPNIDDVAATLQRIIVHSGNFTR